MRGRVVILSVLWLLSSQGDRSAHAQQAAASQGYDAEIALALAAYDAGRYEDALHRFQAAHAVSPSARTHRGIGSAALKLGRYALAREHLRAALDDPRKPLSEDLAAKVRDALALAEASLAGVTAEVAAEASAPQTAPRSAVAPPPVSSAAHTTEPTRPELAPSAAAQHPPAPVAATGGHASSSGRERAARKPPSVLGPIVVASLGGAALVGAGVTGLLARQRASELEEGCPTKQGCDPDLAARSSQGATFRDATNVLLVAGTAALAAGLLWWVSLPGSETRANASLTLGAQACVASVGIEL